VSQDDVITSTSNSPPAGGRPATPLSTATPPPDE
jgi:hypothetical protein